MGTWSEIDEMDEPNIFGVPLHRDRRGSLVAAESMNTVLPHYTSEFKIPFTIRRAFVIFDVPEGAHRGGHFHKTCNQAIILLKGKVEFVITKMPDFTYRNMAWVPGSGYVIPAGYCIDLCFYNNAMVLVLADEPYNPTMMKRCGVPDEGG